jgi:hypothetical protein
MSIYSHLYMKLYFSNQNHVVSSTGIIIILDFLAISHLSVEERILLI